MAQDVIINGVTYPGTPAINAATADGDEVLYYDTSSSDVTAADVLDGKTFFGASGAGTGSMADNGAVGGTISTKSGTVNIPAGRTSGGTVSILASAVSDLTPSALLSGKTVLGVQGTLVTPSISQDSTTKILTIR